MSKRLRHLIQNQPKVKVVAQAQADELARFRFMALALFFAGVFYFFGYYFGWEVLWRALSGG